MPYLNTRKSAQPLGPLTRYGLSNSLDASRPRSQQLLMESKWLEREADKVLALFPDETEATLFNPVFKEPESREGGAF